MITRVPTPAIRALRERLQALDGGTRRRRAVLPFGVPVIDDRLPDGGLALGALHEVAGGGNGAVDGAAAALFAAGIAARTRGRVLWCLTRPDLFAPALAAAGLAPDRVIYVEAGDEKTLLACFEEGLRHGCRSGRQTRGPPGSLDAAGPLGRGGLGAVIAEVTRLSMTASRRLQLAAESSGAIGIVIRRLPAFARTRGSGPDAMTTCDTDAKLEFSEAAWDSLPRSRGRDVEEAWPHAPSLPPAPLPGPPPQAGEGTGRDHSQAGEGAGLYSEGMAGKEEGMAGKERSDDFAEPTAAVTRWRISALPSAPLPVAGVGRARWRLDLIRCRGGEGACFHVEACDAQGRLALPSDLVHGSDQEAPRPRRATR